mmetsp:Transcript_41888/g.90483  ORF Transcript_41888/g.90483 Transcript_41888/m.90483 type:complete len:264 (+) Transcript_41888:1437-2228(+)
MGLVHHDPRPRRSVRLNPSLHFSAAHVVAGRTVRIHQTNHGGVLRSGCDLSACQFAGLFVLLVLHLDVRSSTEWTGRSCPTQKVDELTGAVAENEPLAQCFDVEVALSVRQKPGRQRLQLFVLPSRVEFDGRGFGDVLRRVSFHLLHDCLHIAPSWTDPSHFDVVEHIFDGSKARGYGPEAVCGDGKILHHPLDLVHIFSADRTSAGVNEMSLREMGPPAALFSPRQRVSRAGCGCVESVLVCEGVAACESSLARERCEAPPR